MSSFNSRDLDELFFHMKEFFIFESNFNTDLSKNEITSNIACLVDAEEIENWKEKVGYDECIEFLENDDYMGFYNKQYELFKENSIKNKFKFNSFQNLEEVCNALKHNRKIYIISRDFFLYLNKVTYTPKVFNYYIKNNQLFIYFGEQKGIFISYFTLDKNQKLNCEDIFIVDLPENKKIFVEAIFKYPNMSDSFEGGKNISLNLINLLNYTINKNTLNKKFKTYNFYLDDNIENISGNININTKNNNNIINININNNISKDNINNSKESFNNVNINSMNNINMNSMNNINMNSMNNNNISNNPSINIGDNIIKTDKPFIKENKIIIDQNYYIINKGNNNDNINIDNSSNNFENVKNNSDRTRNDKKQDSFINNKNDEYNSEYKNSYKDKEVEYNEILKEKNIGNNNSKNNINNNEFTLEINNNNNNELNNNNFMTTNDFNTENFDKNDDTNKLRNKTPNIIIQEKEEIIVKEGNNTPGMDIIDDNINNNFNDNKNQNLEINIIHKINEKKEDIENQPKIENKENETKEIDTQTPNGNEIKDNTSKNNIDQNNNILNNNKTEIIFKKIKTYVGNLNNKINLNIDSNINTNSKFSIERIMNHPLIGLDNINGKTSSLNSALQCLSHTVPLTNYFLDEKNKNRILQNNISINSPDSPQLSPSYLLLLKDLWINNNHLKSLNPSEFMKNLKLLNNTFDKDEENDIGELIIFILEQLDSELNEKIENKNSIENSINNNDQNLKKINFYNELFSNNSIIYNTFFGGVCEDTKECLKCKEESENKKIDNDKIYEYRNLNYLIFPINNVLEFVKQNNPKDYINIYDCLNFFQNPVIIDGENGEKCEKCGELSKYLLTSKINSCQNNLLILLKKDKEKENNDIKFKFSEILSMSGFVQEIGERKNLIYYLYAIIYISKDDNYNGNHYIAFCNSPVDKMWYKYDDNKVELVNTLDDEISNLGIPSALFYQKEKENIKS